MVQPGPLLVQPQNFFLRFDPGLMCPKFKIHLSWKFLMKFIPKFYFLTHFWWFFEEPWGWTRSGPGWKLELSKHETRDNWISRKLVLSLIVIDSLYCIIEIIQITNWWILGFTHFKDFLLNYFFLPRYWDGSSAKFWVKIFISLV